MSEGEDVAAVLADLTERFGEMIRLARASERLTSTLRPLKQALETLDSAFELAPELLPEFSAVKERLIEIHEHLEAAHIVLVTKADLLKSD